MELSEEELLQGELMQQYFGFTCAEFTSEFYGILKERIKILCDGLQAVLIEKNEDVDFDQVKKQVENLHKDFLEMIEAPFEDFKKKAEEIFKIPPNLDLYEGSQLALNVGDEEVATLTKQLESLVKEFAREKYFLDRLRFEKKRMERLQPFIEKTKNFIENFKNTSKTIQSLNETEKLIEELRDYCDKLNIDF